MPRSRIPLEPFEQRVRATIERHRLFEGARRVLAAVSGGPDSMALMYTLVRLRNADGDVLPELAVCHVDHGLRGEESAADAEFVRSAAANAGLECSIERIDVRRELQLAGGNLESVARELRYGVLEALAAAQSGTVVATGHTASDQAETVLMRLARGAGVDGLAGIAVQRSLGDCGVRLVRPMLEVTRPDVLAYCADREIRYRRDATNDDVHRTRAAVRHDVLPQLERVAPGAAANLARTARLAADDRAFFEGEIERLFAAWNVPKTGEIRLEASEIRDLAPALSRRAIRESIRRAKGDLSRLTLDHVEAIEALLAPDRVSGEISLPGGLTARREKTFLVVTTSVEK